MRALKRRVCGWFYGRSGIAAGSALLLAFYGVALAPFEWEPPVRVQNAARRTQEGLAFESVSLAYSPANRPWVQEAIQQQQITVQLMVRPSPPYSNRSSWFFTLSADHERHNLVIGQDEADLLVYLPRATDKDEEDPDIVIENAFTGSSWHAIEVHVEGNQLRVSLNGTLVCKQRLNNLPFPYWNQRLPVAIGNELAGTRPWRGVIGKAVVNVRGKSYDLLKHLEIPPVFYRGLRVQRMLTLPPWDWRDRQFQNAVLNLVCFVPCGLLLTLARRHWRFAVVAVVVCSTASFSAEVLQVFFDDRIPSLVDWGLNTLGAAIGAVVAVLLCRQED